MVLLRCYQDAIPKVRSVHVNCNAFGAYSTIDIALYEPKLVTYLKLAVALCYPRSNYALPSRQQVYIQQRQRKCLDLSSAGEVISPKPLPDFYSTPTVWVLVVFEPSSKSVWATCKDPFVQTLEERLTPAVEVCRVGGLHRAPTCLFTQLPDASIWKGAPCNASTMSIRDLHVS